MSVLEKDGKTPVHKMFTFGVSGKMYAELLEQKIAGGFPSMSALIRERIDNRKVIVRHEEFALDEVMWALFRLYNHLSSMDIDLRGISAIQMEAPDEEGISTRSAAGSIDARVEAVRHRITPLLDKITKLSEKWLPE